MQILAVQKEHLPRIAALEEACFSAPWSEAALLEALENPAYTLLAAFDGETLLGYGGMYTVAGENSVTNIAVFPENRRIGVGRALVRGLVRAAEEQDADSLTLEVRVSNTGARALYESEGFQNLGVRPRFYEKPEEDAVIYTRFLK